MHLNISPGLSKHITAATPSSLQSRHIQAVQMFLAELQGVHFGAKTLVTLSLP